MAKRKNIKKKKPHPYRYVQFRGCFGHSLRYKRDDREEIDLGRAIGIYEEGIYKQVADSFNAVLDNPDIVLNMRKVNMITINGGLLLRAFFDEFCLKYNEKPHIKGPKNQKARAVLKYLKIKNYQDVKVENHSDIMCWQVLSWDYTHTDIEFGKLLDTEIIPKCWKGDHSISQHSSNIATSVAETLLNCKEHAYTGEKSRSDFKKWYLGVGEYPDTRRFSFCIYDKGVGIKARLQSNPAAWHEDLFDKGRSDSAMIELATKGKRVITEDGRGQGLKSAIELLEKNDGKIDIFSDKGFFSTYHKEAGRDRISRLEGTMVSFSFPIEYSKDSV